MSNSPPALDSHLRSTLYRRSRLPVCFNLLVRQHQLLEFQNQEVAAKAPQLLQYAYNFYLNILTSLYNRAYEAMLFKLLL
jgi:hypothetical protein